MIESIEWPSGEMLTVAVELGGIVRVKMQTDSGSTRGRHVAQLADLIKTL